MKKITLLLLVLLTFSAKASTPAGSLDNTFGNNGVTTTHFTSGMSQIWGMGIDSNKNIVAGGFAWNGKDLDFAVARYKPNGVLDSTFGVNGMVITAVGDSNDLSFALVVQPDNKIVLGGFSYVANKGYDFAAVRYTTNGLVDSTFGVNGIALAAPGAGDDKAFCMALQNDWSIVMGGASFNGTTNEFAVVRFKTNGALDASYGHNGIVTTQMGTGDATSYGMTMQSDWSIVLGGSALGAGGTNAFALARIDSTGKLDNSFGDGGKVLTTFNSADAGAYAVALQPDGKILATGYENNGQFNDFAISRYNINGSPDTSFNHTGMATTGLGDSVNAMYAIAVQPDGKIVSAGSVYNGATQNSALTRYKPDGTLDEDFGGNGKVVTPLSDNTNIDYAVAIQSDGKILVSGYNTDSTQNNFALARYISGLALGVINLSRDDNSILIYPNPVAQTATLEYTLQNNEQISIKLLDMQGRTVKYFVTSQNETAGDYKQALVFPADLAAGSYIIAIEGTSGTLSIKIVK